MTLVECLVAVTMLAVCVGPLLAAVVSSQRRTTEAQERIIVLREVLGEIERQRGFARQGYLSEMDMERELDLPLVSTPLILRIQINLMSGYSDLYKVKVTGSWSRSVSPVSVTTRMRCPDG